MLKTTMHKNNNKNDIAFLYIALTISTTELYIYLFIISLKNTKHTEY